MASGSPSPSVSCRVPTRKKPATGGAGGFVWKTKQHLCQAKYRLARRCEVEMASGKDPLGIVEKDLLSYASFLLYPRHFPVRALWRGGVRFGVDRGAMFPDGNPGSTWTPRYSTWASSRFGMRTPLPSANSREAAVSYAFAARAETQSWTSFCALSHFFPSARTLRNTP